jgi:hypothetical protein
MASRQAGPTVATTASPPEELPAITSYAPGDTVTVRAVTPLIPGGLEVAGRLDQVEVNAAQGVATWSIIGATPAPVARESVTERLDRVDSAVANLFHGGQLVEVGAPPNPQWQLNGVVTAGAWNAAGTGWARVSDLGPMRISPPVGAAVVIEALGILTWRQNDLEVGLSWFGATGSGQVATARVEGRSRWRWLPASRPLPW